MNRLQVRTKTPRHHQPFKKFVENEDTPALGILVTGVEVPIISSLTVNFVNNCAETVGRKGISPGSAGAR